MTSPSPQKVLLIVGHPDPSAERFCRALALAYEEGARQNGHAVRVIDVARLNIPFLRTQQEFESGVVPEQLRPAAADIAWADHMVLVFPLWLGTMPAMLKAFMEQLFRPGVAFRYRDKGLPEKLLHGKSARLVVTMGMPAFVYSLWYRARGVRGLEHNILRFTGVAPVRTTLIGLAGGAEAGSRVRWLTTLHRMGCEAE